MTGENSSEQKKQEKLIFQVITDSSEIIKHIKMRIQKLELIFLVIAERTGLWTLFFNQEQNTRSRKLISVIFQKEHTFMRILSKKNKRM